MLAPVSIKALVFLFPIFIKIVFSFKPVTRINVVGCIHVRFVLFSSTRFCLCAYLHVFEIET